ncbi:MAG TPA: gliding motility-associated C-terminal domain-containing protein [Bacteroidales bacterium]|nr:gliding motility-associated C-terminal domain-containing protein [Bacteroidales bacterium]HOH22323.1 gliding motility-associated C-terminal domain-containing protein [Bacteroidales bacterium]HPZ03256.1 gliding motility-associated C-terminal domain-containing protein [Bacteroidales bacterium]HQB74639.1 gliding motility-associated C-terminal domain-containing protein [Bacteroidales bacterium]
MKNRIFLLLLLMSSLYSWATHNRAGEISYRHLYGLTYEFTIITYTYTPSPADRPQIEILWGDGSSSIVNRTSKENLGNDISRNTYIINHTYSSMGNYRITFEDPNRNAGVINIPNSVYVPFFVDTWLVINPFLGSNNSPVLLNPPIDNGCIHVPFYHNPGAYDVDGDSLSYKIVACRGFHGQVIPGYTVPAASNYFSIDSITGELTWDSPILVGEYNIAIQIDEYRNGTWIGSMVRDMQVTIAACNNEPPEIVTIIDTCVTAGDLLELEIMVTDANSSQVSLTATGAPLLYPSSPAIVESGSGPPPLFSFLKWQTNCSHIKKDKQTVLLKAIDNGPIIPLASFKTIYITVVAPKPENLTATPIGNQIQLQWSPSVCPNTSGYQIYKRINSSPFEPDNCQTGLPPEAGYTLIGATNNINDTTFLDDGTQFPIHHGNEYCYRIVAFYPDGAESYVSDEACTYIVNDAPMITHVDVEKTDRADGEIMIRWIDPPEIDSTIILSLCSYKLYRSTSGSGSYQLITAVPFFGDHEYVDVGLNTIDFRYFYKIEFWGEETVDSRLIETSDPASSHYLSALPTDRAIKLHWTAQVPWQDIAYTIYRYNPVTDQMDSIATTEKREYLDQNLSNEVEYGYLVRATGAYFVPDTLYPLLNRSQIVFEKPIDDQPPEMPLISITTDCIDVTIEWKFEHDSAYQDVFKYYIYYRLDYLSEYYLLDSVVSDGSPCYPAPCIYEIEDPPHITGCYRLALVDTVGNMTPFSEETCFDIEDCMFYELPNVFTPNNDGINDLWIPFPYSNVEEIDLYIYNRWGRKVFHTNDPDINWDGRDYLSGEPVSNGVYYYSCTVYVQTLYGIKEKKLHGTVTLIRG